MQQDDFQMDRPKDAAKLAGFCLSGYYAAAAEGLMPKPFKIGSRASAIPRREVNAVNAARAAGKTDAEIRALVQRMAADRATRFQKLMGQLDDTTRQAA